MHTQDACSANNNNKDYKHYYGSQLCCDEQVSCSCSEEGRRRSCCINCPPVTVVPQGPAGPVGPQGPAGGVLNFADFYALMPPDNAATVAPGTDVSFPQDGPNSGADIARTGPSSFNLAQIGTYQVLFQVSVTEAGQLLLTLNDADLAYTVVGRAAGTTEIVGMAIVKTTSVDSILTVRNPAGSAAALTITPLAGGTKPVSAHLVITQIR